MYDDTQRAFALVGPGRAGTTIALALSTRGWRCVGVGGRAVDAPGVLTVAELLGAPTRAATDAGRDADLVIVAPPDAVIADVAAALAPSLRAGSLVLHLSGVCTLGELDKLRGQRPDVAVGSLHPLQSFPSPEVGVTRLPGSWCAVDGPPAVEQIAVSLGLRPFRIDDSRRVAYHAAATVASNHLVALMGQVARLAEAAGVPPAALLPLVRSTLDNVDACGPAGALTGPIRRGDVDTVARHLGALPADEQRALPCARRASVAARRPRRSRPARSVAGCRPGIGPRNHPVITVETIAETRAACDAARMTGMMVGFVPTMGFFHEGHRSLMRAARAANDFVVVSLFVNPTQFAPTEDLSTYPRDPEGDAAAAEAEGVDVLFMPTVSQMYPGDAVTTVHVDGLTRGLCARSRPTHFDGVTTVVAKLFSIVGPCRAYFGRKDAQQLAVVRRMATDLDLPVEVVGCPLVREPDGLAMSSRNAYLTADGRRAATVLSRALFLASEAAANGERDAAVLRRIVVDTIASEPAVRLDYAEVVDARTLEPLERVDDRSSRRRCRVRRRDPADRQRHLLVPRQLARYRSRRAHQLVSQPGALMYRTMMKSKIHRATITGADLNYVGSITIDPRLMELADLMEHEQVHVLDVDNGARFETYVIRGGPGDIIVNGAAARLVHKGDRVIVISYAQYDAAELEQYEPLVVHVDDANRPTVHSVREVAP